MISGAHMLLPLPSKIFQLSDAVHHAFASKLPKVTSPSAAFTSVLSAAVFTFLICFNLIPNKSSSSSVVSSGSVSVSVRSSEGSVVSDGSGSVSGSTSGSVVSDGSVSGFVSSSVVVSEGSVSDPVVPEDSVSGPVVSCSESVSSVEASSDPAVVSSGILFSVSVVTSTYKRYPAPAFDTVF